MRLGLRLLGLGLRLSVVGLGLRLGLGLGLWTYTVRLWYCRVTGYCPVVNITGTVSLDSGLL